jgi:hypothetical protein
MPFLSPSSLSLSLRMLIKSSTILQVGGMRILRDVSEFLLLLLCLHPCIIYSRMNKKSEREKEGENLSFMPRGNCIK